MSRELEYLLHRLDPDDPFQKTIEEAIEGNELHVIEAKKITLHWERLTGNRVLPERPGVRVTSIPNHIRASLLQQQASVRHMLADNPNNKIAANILERIDLIIHYYSS